MKKYKMIYGTCYFPTILHALKYYKSQGYDEDAVTYKIQQREITVGRKPPLAGDEECWLNEEEGRYFVGVKN